MKFLLIVFIFAFLIMFWRKRQAEEAAAEPPPAPKARPGNAQRGTEDPLMMVACARCGTHVPQNDAVRGHAGSYCSAAHRSASESAA